MLWEAFGWFINALEVIAVITAILVIGLTSTVVVLRVFSKVASPPVELSPDPDEIVSSMADDPIPPVDASAPPL